MTLHLNPDVEARLIALARDSGVSVEDFLQHIVEEQSAVVTSRHRMSPEEWSAQFEEWADSFPEAPLIPDEALSRDQLYPDR